MNETKKIKILILNYEYPPLGGGGGVGCQKLALELAKTNKYEITVLTSTVGNKIEEYYEAENLKVIRLNCAKIRKNLSTATFFFMFNYIIKACLYAIKNFKKGSFDLIHTYFAIPTGPAGLFISKFLKTSHILTLIGGEFFQQPLETSLIQNSFLKLALGIIIKNADYLTAISNDTKNATLSLFPNLKKDITVISLGFTKPDLNVNRRKINNENDVFKIVSVSRLVPRKGYSYLIEALALIKNENWSLTIIGEGPERDSLLSLAKKLKIDDRVQFTDFVSDEKKFRLLSESDLFVLPTLHEGLGIVYFEAMYCGLPIITTDNGGQTDFLKNGENALLIPIKDHLALKDAIIKAMKDEKWREKASKNNLDDIKKQYLENIVIIYDKYFQRILHG